jgi:thiol-disulfide isomerase/thioredoxin
MERNRWTARGFVGSAALMLLVALFVWRCDDDDGTPTNLCTQLLCEGGSSLCCDPVVAGTWDATRMACNCPPPVTDADADGDDVPGPDADGDDVPGPDADGDGDGDGVDPCWDYPCGSTGTRLGNILPDTTYESVTAAADEYLGDDGVFGMRDLYQANEAHGGTLTSILLYVTTVWCPYCGQEAAKLEDLYQELRDDGVLLVGIITDGATPGRPATAAEGRAYATRYGWTFPAVIGDVANNYWPPDDVASGEIGVPLHLFVDPREMRLYGRFAGAVEMKMPRYALQEIATAPSWESPGVRSFSFDCAPGTGTETEPNDGTDGIEDGTGYAATPYTLAGVFCPPTVGDGLLLDVDVVDLGRLTAGTVIDVSMTTAGTSTFPFFQLAPASSAGGYATLGPSAMSNDDARRQWVILAADDYAVVGVDGRQMSGFYYGEGATVPLADQCCEGGPGYDYELTVSPFTLAPTDGAVAVGTPVTNTFEDGSLDVFSLDVTSGTAYTVRMTATNTDRLDPYLVIYNPTGSVVLGSNDDEASGNYNSLVRFTAAAAGTVYVVAGYYAVSFVAPPEYTLTVN